MTTLRSSGAVRAGAAFFASRILLALTVLLVAGVTGQGAVDHEWATGIWWLDRFSVWDSYHFIRIASLGYLPPGLDCCDQAYFPGYPLLMAAIAPLTGGNITAAGLLISLVAGAVAAGLLWTLVADDPRGVQRTIDALEAFSRARPDVQVIPTHCPEVYAALR